MKTHTHLKIAALSLFLAGCGTLYWATGSQAGIDELWGEITQSSVSKKAKRMTELGTAVPSKEALDKEVSVIMKDPAMNQKWGLLSTDSERAWRLTRGSKKIIVAVIDTGIDVHHPDLQTNLWVNQGETGVDAKGKNKATNGVDDDGNGLIDDVHGWNFVGQNNDLADNHGHGTHIAGIIGAVGGNGVGISGVSPKVSIMTLKYYDPKSSGANNLSNTVKAIRYAVEKGAHIINYSGGGLEPSKDERDAIRMAQEKGVLFVAAAGNEKSNSDIHGYYPADYDLPNIVSVTAINKDQKVLPTSNYGERSVDLAAPGNSIYSTLPKGQYGFMTGTSQATAFVSGVAALVMANNPEFQKGERIIKYLTQTGDFDEKLVGKTRYKKRLNAYRALAIKDGDLGVTGVRAENAVNMDRHAFASDPNDREEIQPVSGLPANQIASFSRAIQEHLVVEQQQQRKAAAAEKRAPLPSQL